MNLSVDFFRDEIREGFYVPTAIKQMWAENLKALAEIDRVCKEHDIKYFADMGTMIGCARHGGFVPWDDDLDIGMCREDYERFREVADSELPEGYVIHDYERKEGHWLFLARVVSREKICFEADFLNDHNNFPWLVGIDIFLKDNLYDDPQQERARDDEVMHIIAVADSIVEGKLEESVVDYWLSEFEKKYELRMDRASDPIHTGIELYRLAERQMSRLSYRDSHTMGQIFPLIIKGHKPLPDKCFVNTIDLPFETDSIPMPAGYHAILQSSYGDYFRIIKQGGAHGYPFFEGQKAELMSHADFEYPSYKYEPESRREEGLWEACREAAGIDAEGRREVLFLATGSMLWEGFERLYRKECESGAEVTVLALPICFKDCYGRLLKEDGKPAESEDELPEVNAVAYPEYVEISDWRDYDIAEHLPERVYIQDAYDGENPLLSIPPRFYAVNVRDFCKELVLVPALVPEEFPASYCKEHYAMKYYVTAPGVAYADKVLLRAEWLKERYMEKLCEWAGEETRACWEEKLKLLPVDETESAGEALMPSDEFIHMAAEAEEGEAGKRVLYVAGLDGLVLKGEAYIDELRRKLDEFTKDKGVAGVSLMYYPPDKEEWLRLEPELSGRLDSLVSEFVREDKCRIEEWNKDAAAAYDAYYGSASPAALGFRLAGKEVNFSEDL